MYIGYVVVRIGPRRVSLFCCELMSLLESCLAMRRGLSNPTRPSLPGPLRDPDIATRGESTSVMPVPTGLAVPPRTAFQGECSRRDTLSVTMRPLVTIPEWPTLSEFMAGMGSETSELNSWHPTTVVRWRPKTPSGCPPVERANQFPMPLDPVDCPLACEGARELWSGQHGKGAWPVFESAMRNKSQDAHRAHKARRHACVQADAPWFRKRATLARGIWPAHRRPLLARGAAAWARASKEVESVWFCMGMHTFMNCPSGEGEGSG